MAGQLELSIESNGGPSRVGVVAGQLELSIERNGA